MTAAMDMETTLARQLVQRMAISLSSSRMISLVFVQMGQKRNAARNASGLSIRHALCREDIMDRSAGDLVQISECVYQLKANRSYSQTVRDLGSLTYSRY